MKHVASYARFSSENQRETSIEDQLRMCQKFAEQEGMVITREYTDKAMRGKLENRPDYVRLVRDIKNGEISVLLVDDLSRLSRNINTPATVDEFQYYGTRVVCVSDGIDTVSKTSKVAIAVKGLVNNIFLDDLKAKVHRGLEGNALKGHNTGGKVYGYDPEPHYSTSKTDIYGRPEIEFVTRKINEEQAEVIRQVFEWAAEGRHYQWIAKELNCRGIAASNGGTWTTSTINSTTNGVPTGVLNNQLYIGIYTWNKTENTYHPQTGKKKNKKRDESEWLVKEMPELRIVSNELWSRVKERQRIQKQKTKKKQAETHENARTGRPPKRLFSGVLKCSECGGNLVIVDQKQNYRCVNAHRRGPAVCKNKQKVSRYEIEEMLLVSIKNDLFRTEAVEAFRKEAEASLKQRMADFEPNIRNVKTELRTIEKQLNNLITSIMDNPALANSEKIASTISELEAEKRKSEEELKAHSAMVHDIAPMLPRATERFHELVSDLPEALSGHIEPLRAQVTSLLGDEIIMTPGSDGSWKAAYRGSYRGFLRLGDPGLKISNEALRRPFFISGSVPIIPLIKFSSESRIWRGIIPIHKCSIQNEPFSTIDVIIEVDWP
ncbi:MAG: recombinase family protein [Candidatus Thiodiazotropha endolucinida]